MSEILGLRSFLLNIYLSNGSLWNEHLKLPRNGVWDKSGDYGLQKSYEVKIANFLYKFDIKKDAFIFNDKNA